MTPGAVDVMGPAVPGFALRRLAQRILMDAIGNRKAALPTSRSRRPPHPGPSSPS